MEEATVGQYWGCHADNVQVSDLQRLYLHAKSGVDGEQHLKQTLPDTII